MDRPDEALADLNLLLGGSYPFVRGMARLVRPQPIPQVVASCRFAGGDLLRTMPSDLALLRFSVVSAYLALEPGRGARGPLLAQLARRDWPGPDGDLVRFAPETIRGWVRRFRVRGLSGLEDAPRPKRGTVALSAETVAQLAALKRQVGQRTLDMLIRIAEDMKLVPKGQVRRSTLHRALVRLGLSGRPTPERSVKDLDRYEADNPNDTWQGDAKAGPWLPDPARPGKRRQAWLFAFIDDHSRLLVGGRWAFRQDQPTMELVFRRSLQRHGKPKRCYTDNGSVYRARHMAKVCGELDIVLVFCTAERPEGKGKIERFFRTVVVPFVAEVEASSIRTIDALNDAWRAWLERHYHDEIHGETDMKPPDRWKAGIDKLTWVDEERLRNAFRWSEHRTADKAGCFTLFGVRFQVGATLARGRVHVRYDPEDLSEIEVLGDDRKVVERLRPFAVTTHRRPQATPAPAPAAAEVATVDYLVHLVDQHKPAPEPTARQVAAADRRRRQDADDAVVAVLTTQLDPGAFDEARIRAWLDRFGPLDADHLAEALPAILARLGAGTHVQVLLDTFRKENP